LKTEEVSGLQAEVERLRLLVRESEASHRRGTKELKDSHLNEAWWWKLRVEEKNELIQILARRIAHLSATDIHGYFLDGIVREIRKVHERYPAYALNSEVQDLPRDSNSLLNYFNAERSRIMVIPYPTNNSTLSFVGELVSLGRTA
jgi:hypothetical protein